MGVSDSLEIQVYDVIFDLAKTDKEVARLYQLLRYILDQRSIQHTARSMLLRIAAGTYYLHPEAVHRMRIELITRRLAG